MTIEGFEEIAGSDLIQDTFLFENLNFTEAQNLARICHLKRFSQGEVVIEENALGQALYLVHKGLVKVVKAFGKGSQEIAELGPGQLFGEMSLIEDDLTSAGVIAATELELFVIYRGEFEDTLKRDQGLALKIYKSFCKTLSERLRKTTMELGQLRGMSAKSSAPSPARASARREKRGK